MIIPPRRVFPLVVAALGRAAVQVRERAMLGILIRSLVISLAAFIALAVATSWLLGAWGGFEGWLGWAVDVLGWAAFLVLTWLLFPAIVSLAVTLYLDDAAAAVEQRHYGDDAPGRSQGFWPSFAVGLRFTAFLIVINIAALPLYVIVFFVPFVGAVIYYAINGYFLSREYFDLVAMRHMPEQDAYALRRRNATKLFVAGVAFAFLLTIPVVNIAAPLVAVAAMVHIFKSLRSAAPPAPPGRLASG